MLKIESPIPTRQHPHPHPHPHMLGLLSAYVFLILLASTLAFYITSVPQLKTIIMYLARAGAALRLSAGLMAASNITADYVFQGNDTKDDIEHRDYNISTRNPCGILVRDGGELILARSTLVRSEDYTADENLAGPSWNAIACVVSRLVIRPSRPRLHVRHL
jgi:hypothetical protein